MEKVKNSYKSLNLPPLQKGSNYLTFNLIYLNLRDLINWQIKTELLSEDIRHYRRIISMMRALIGMTGQYDSLVLFEDLHRRLIALQVRYDLYD